MLTMKDIIREGNPTLRAVCDEVPVPLTAEDIQLGKDMLEFLHNSQDPEMAEKYELRGGVGLAAPQLDIKKRIGSFTVELKYFRSMPWYKAIFLSNFFNFTIVLFRTLWYNRVG
ncbi:peptide deformylase [Enterococcus cecorum]